MSACAKGRGVIHQGDKTTTGGVVTSGVSNVMFFGSGVTQINMIATCPACKKGQGKIIPIEDIAVIVDNVQVALHGDVVDCGCPFGSNTLIASVGAMKFSQSNGRVHGYKAYANEQEKNATYQNVADSMNGNYVGAKSSQFPTTLLGGEQELVSKSTTTIDPNNAYWPPYNPLAKEGEKDLDVIYQKKITSIAVLSVEESYEFLQTLYRKHGERQLSDDFKTYVIGVGKGSYDALKNARGLGSYGVKATVKTIDGVDWVIIRNFRFHQQTLMAGYKWKANNPQVIKMALGLKDLGSVKNLVRVNVGLEVAFAVGINAVDFILRDEAILAEFVGNSAYDIVKGVTALAGSTAVTALLVTGLAVSSVLVGGLIFVAVSYIVGSIVNSTFDFVEKKIEKKAETQAEKEVEDYIERINGYSFSMSDAFRKVAL